MREIIKDVGFAMFPVFTLFTGLGVGALLQYQQQSSFEEHEQQSKHEVFERRIAPYKAYIAPQPYPAKHKITVPQFLLTTYHFAGYNEMYTMDLAAAEGRLNLIKSDHHLLQDYFEEKLRDYSVKYPYRDGMRVGYSWRAPIAAARFGHLEILKWFEPLQDIEDIVKAAEEGNHQDILAYVKEKHLSGNY